MGFFDKGKPVPGQPQNPVLNNTLNVAIPNVNLVDDVDYKASRSAAEAAAIAEAAVIAAAKSAQAAKEYADEAAESASQAEGWDAAYAEAEKAVDAANEAIADANQAINNADVVYYGFTNLTADAESVPADQDADAIWNGKTYNMHFKIPKGLDGTIEGLADAPIITDVDKTDYIMVVDKETDAVSKATVDDFLDLTVKTVNGYGPDDNGNVNIQTGEDAPVLYVGESVLMVANKAPAGTLPADGTIKMRADFPDLWAAIESGALASVSETDWQAGQNDVFSTGDGSTSFRLPLFTDNGEIVMTEGDYTLNGNITFANPVEFPKIVGTTTQDGDFIVTDTSRGVGIDTYIINRSANEGAGYDIGAVAFVDRKNQNKVVGGIFTDHSDNTVGLLANLGDTNVGSQVGDVNVVATAGDVNVTGETITLNGLVALGNTHTTDLNVTGDATVTGRVTAGGIHSGDIVSTGTVAGTVGQFSPGASSTIPNAVVQLAFDTGSSNGAFIDLASGKGNSDNDARIMVTNGNASTSTKGDLTISAGTFSVNASPLYLNAGTTYIGGNVVIPHGSYLFCDDKNGTPQTVVSMQEENGADFTRIGNSNFGMELQAYNTITTTAHMVLGNGQAYWMNTGQNNTRFAAYQDGWLEINSDQAYGVNITANGRALTLNGHTNTIALQSDIPVAIEEVHAEYRPLIEELRAEIAALKEKLNA